MGKGLDLAIASGMDPELAQALDDMKEQLLIVLVDRLKGKVTIPVAEIDDTKGKILMMEIFNDSFVFKVQRTS